MHINNSLRFFAFSKAIFNSFFFVILCLENTKCWSLNLKILGNDDLECQLLEADRFNNATDYVAASNYVHHSIQVKQVDNKKDR